MPKIAEYPVSSIKKSLELAKTVDELGGSSTIEVCAEKLGKKVSGGFSQIIQSAVKYGFIVRKKGILSILPCYRDIKLAYNENERISLLQKAFLNVPLFQKMCNRFANQKLPVEILNKLLIKEFGVPERMARSVKTYFMGGAKEVGLITPDNIIVLDRGSQDDAILSDTADQKNSFERDEIDSKESKVASSPNSYIVKFLGPGINSTITINELEDLAIVKVILNKVEKKLNTKTDES
jgi:hypothetical protein